MLSMVIANSDGDRISLAGLDRVVRELQNPAPARRVLAAPTVVELRMRHTRARSCSRGGHNATGRASGRGRRRGWRG
jgi:hypothetical protein